MNTKLLFTTRPPTTCKGFIVINTFLEDFRTKILKKKF